MAFTERQRQMLKAMGLRLWPASSSSGADVAADSASAAAPALGPLPEPALEAATARAAVLAEAVAKQPGSVATPATRFPDVQSLDWDGLRAAVTSCRACGLCESRRQTVFGSGHMQADWMIVGEAPGAEEDATGEAFVGASGQLLDAMLHALGLSRQTDADPAQSVFIANTLKCRPPANRNPQKEEMQCCAPFLQRQIDLLRPRIILAMGRYAAQALLGDSAPLGQLRGRVHRCADTPLVVTYHPSYLLRSPGEKAKAWADLCMAAAAVQTPASR